LSPRYFNPGAVTEDELARYGSGFKKRALARLLPPENASIEMVAANIGVQPETLARWRDEAAAGKGEQVGWTAAARLDAVLVTAAMDEIAKSAWCRANAVHAHELEQWRKAALDALGEPKPAKPVAAGSQSQSKEDKRRIQELERDLRRKNAALAETTALLVLSKEMAAIFRKGEDE
jgi:transposase